MTLRDHLLKFGIQHFDDKGYWQWRSEMLGPRFGKQLDRLGKPLMRAAPKKADLFAFYDYIARPEIAAVVHSAKADAIRATGEFVDARIAGERILDVGCSIGYLTIWYALQHPWAQVFGIDISPSSIQTGKRFATRMGATNLQLVAADARKFVPEEPFDCVIDTQGFIEPRTDAEDLRILISLLRPGGRLICVPALGTELLFDEFLHKLIAAEAAVLSLAWVNFSDLGDSGAFPAMTLARTEGGAGMSHDELRASFHLGLQKFRNHGFIA